MYYLIYEANNKSHKMEKIFKKQNKSFYQRKNKINNKIAKERIKNYNNQTV